MLISLRLGLLASPNRTHSRHWAVAAKRRKALAWEVWAALQGQSRPESPIRLAYVRIARCSSGRLDIDNLYASAKPLLDVLQPLTPRRPLGLGIIAGDRDDQLCLTVANATIPRSEKPHTLVWISDLPLTHP